MAQNFRNQEGQNFRNLHVAGKTWPGRRPNTRTAPPAPFIGEHGRPDLNPVTRYILEKYGDDGNVFSSWVAGMHTGGAFAGSIADHTEERASRARPFLDFPSEAVR